LAIGSIWRQETFQGNKRKRDYFEGWYFKLIDKSRKTVLAIIPGISIGENRKDAHAFIQLIDAVRGKTEYYRFAFEEFKADKNKFNVHIGCNHFSDKGLEINLSNENSRIFGSLCFDKIEKYPQSFFNPGIMGPFSFVPGMECYHGVVNISHTISGSLNINETQIDMTGGEGYIEKDWGRSFPQSWIWLQANHFEDPGASFMFSVARIPWLGRSFTGLISFLRTDNGFYKFATYNGGKIKHIKIDGDTMEVSLKSRAYTLEFTANYTKGGILKAPKNGLMRREIEESITAEVALNLSDHKGNKIFQGASKWVGMEIAGFLDETL
jgi:tocopherol cyclase